MRVYVLKIGPFVITSTVDLHRYDNSVTQYDHNYDDIREHLQHSYELEKETLSTDTANEIINVLPYANIEMLYHVMFPERQFKRETFVGIPKGKSINGDTRRWANVGMNYTDINYELLQSAVDEYHEKYSNNWVIGFILYLMFERVHPLSDGNGRIGRALFVDYSSMSKCVKPDRIINECFESVSFPKTIKRNTSIDYIHDIPSDNYYLLFVNDHLLRNVEKLSLMVREYDSLTHSIPCKSKAEIAKIIRKL